MYAGISGLSPSSSPAWRPHSKNWELETSQRREKKETVSSVGRTGVLFPLTGDRAAKSQAGGQLGSGNTVLTHRRVCQNSGLRKWCLEEKPLPQQRMGSGVCGRHRHVFTELCAMGPWSDHTSRRAVSLRLTICATTYRLCGRGPVPQPL